MLVGMPMHLVLGSRGKDGAGELHVLTIDQLEEITFANKGVLISPVEDPLFGNFNSVLVDCRLVSAHKHTVARPESTRSCPCAARSTTGINATLDTYSHVTAGMQQDGVEKIALIIKANA